MRDGARSGLAFSSRSPFLADLRTPSAALGGGLASWRARWLTDVRAPRSSLADEHIRSSGRVYWLEPRKVLIILDREF